MEPGFNIIVLGCSGGPKEVDLSGYLVYPRGCSQQSIAFDAGSMLGGLEAAYHKNSLVDFTFEHGALTQIGEVYLKYLKAFLLSHAHLDHISGLVLNSAADTSHKFILGTDPTIDNLRDHIFNGKIWPNCANEGVSPNLNTYQYIRMPLHERIKIPRTAMQVEAYRLSHPHDYPSTAFLLEHEGEYVVYCGDTSPDALEEKKYLSVLWKRVAPLIREGKLRGMMLECSVSDEDSAQVIYGHLNPTLMMQELHHLAELTGDAIRGLKVIVTHRKESLYQNKMAQTKIAEELAALNTLGLHLIFPSQGDRITI